MLCASSENLDENRELAVRCTGAACAGAGGSKAPAALATMADAPSALTIGATLRLDALATGEAVAVDDDAAAEVGSQRLRRRW